MSTSGDRGDKAITCNHAQQRCQNNRVKKIPNLTFHQFASDESIQKQWVVKIRRDVGESFQVSW